MKIIPKETQEKIKKQLAEQSDSGDVFYNIEYSGIDLAGNRYILKSKKARLDELKPEIVYMDEVHAIFYFKEAFELGHALAFSLIWVALFIYSFEGISKELSKEGMSVSTLSKKLR